MRLNKWIISARNMQLDLIEYRRSIHQYPELSFCENKTTEYIKGILDGFGIESNYIFENTGLIACIGNGKPQIAIRAELDALPINEESGESFASKISGVMHACGHDIHLAILLGVAKLLNNVDLKGSVFFIFQPAEEQFDQNGISGARYVLDKNQLLFRNLDGMLGFHVNPEIPLGKIGIKSGYVTASSALFRAKIMGKGGHAANPEKLINPIFIASQILNKLFLDINRTDEEHLSNIISVGSVQTESTYNVVPDIVKISGVIRSKDPDKQSRIINHLKEILNLSYELGGSYELDIVRGSPPILNNTNITEKVLDTIRQILGKDMLIEFPQSMLADDFALYSKDVPSCYFWLGIKDEKQDDYPLHSPKFNPNEDVLAIGAGILTGIITNLLNDDHPN